MTPLSFFYSELGVPNWRPVCSLSIVSPFFLARDLGVPNYLPEEPCPGPILSHRLPVLGRRLRSQFQHTTAGPIGFGVPYQQTRGNGAATFLEESCTARRSCSAC